MNKGTEFRQYTKRIVVISFNKNYSDVWRSISEKIEVKRIVLFDQETKSTLPVFNKIEYIQNIIKALFYRKQLTVHLKHDEVVVIVGHVILPFLIHNFLKLRKSSNYRVYVFSLFFHNPILMYFYGKFVKILTPPAIKFIAFSKADIPLFKKHFNLLDSQIMYVPYGIGPVTEIQSMEGDYLFAGGYSNRNYAFLINAFKELEENLVICYSKHNRLPSDLPDNVTVFYDLPGDEFSRLIAGSQICILPLYADSGASGQSVCLQYMQFCKPIIATRVLAATDYLNDQNAILIQPDSSEDLIEAVRKLVADKQMRTKLGKQVQYQYFQYFQRQHFEKKILNILMSGR